MHGQKLLINAGAANDPHLVVFCGFQMREQVRHGREPMFQVAAVAAVAAVVAAAVVAAVVVAVVVAVMGREN